MESRDFPSNWAFSAVLSNKIEGNKIGVWSLFRSITWRIRVTMIWDKKR